MQRRWWTNFSYLSSISRRQSKQHLSLITQVDSVLPLSLHWIQRIDIEMKESEHENSHQF